MSLAENNALLARAKTNLTNASAEYNAAPDNATRIRAYATLAGIINGEARLVYQRLRGQVGSACSQASWDRFMAAARTARALMDEWEAGRGGTSIMEWGDEEGSVAQYPTGTVQTSSGRAVSVPAPTEKQYTPGEVFRPQGEPKSAGFDLGSLAPMLGVVAAAFAGWYFWLRGK